MTSSSLNMFKIKLDNPTATYKSGAIINGQVIIDLAKSHKLRALKIRFKGESLVRWSSKKFKINSEDFFGHDVYFREDICLFGVIGGDPVDLPSGHHVYPFTYVLPENIPNSFEHSIGCVKYSIKAIIDRPWRSDYKTSKMFSVVSSSGTQPGEWEGSSGVIDHKYVKNYSCIFPSISNGSLNYRIQLPKVMYSLGENIQTIIYLNNKSNSIQVNKIEVNLVQELQFHARTPYQKSITKTNLVKNSSQSGPFDKKSNVVINMRVPFITPSKLEHCKLIDINYQIHILIHVPGFHRKIKKVYNIFIGKGSSFQPIEDTLSKMISSLNSGSCGLLAPSNASTISFPQSQDPVSNIGEVSPYPENIQNLMFDNQMDGQYPSSSSTPYPERASPLRFSPRNSPYSAQPEPEQYQTSYPLNDSPRSDTIGFSKAEHFQAHQSVNWLTETGQTLYLQAPYSAQSESTGITNSNYTLISDTATNYCIPPSYETAMTLL